MLNQKNNGEPLVSRAEIVTEWADMRNELRKVIAASKRVLASIPSDKRAEFLQTLVEAERRLNW